MNLAGILSEEGMTHLREEAGRVMDLSWMETSEHRRSRWNHLFDPALCESEEDKLFVDLEKDEVLDSFYVSKAERVRRRWVTEFVLDNMMRMADGHLTDPSLLMETTNKTDIAAFTTWALPMIRKWLPRNFLWNIVPTYPMAQATGKVFTADTNYGTSSVYASGSSIFDYFDAAYADDPGECEDPNELDFQVTSDDIEAISLKLKGVWNIEAAQDLLSYHRLIMENEVVRMLGIVIERQVNRYGINQIVANATTTTSWTATQPMAGTNAWSNAIPREYAESLWDAIEDANRAIKDQIYRNANFILCGTQFGSRLRKLNGFRLLHDNDPGNAINMTSNIVTGAGPHLLGTMEGRYVVYEDADFTTDRALIGHRGNTWQWTGAVYCPYVPVWRTPIIHTLTMCPGVGYLTRFGFKVINGDFYGLIQVV